MESDENWADLIKRDLAPFVGRPGIKYEQIGRRLVADWASNRAVKRASFDCAEDGAIGVSFEGHEMGYREFLASESMSDMWGVAGAIVQLPGPALFVETRARRQVPGAPEGQALSVMREAAAPNTEGPTKVVFVTGDAGAGKTEVLKQLVRVQAESYLKGESDFLYLYVNAQGRALARLEEALAIELQDLRASKLTYHSVPVLTRNGLIVPIIDGFDELLGVLGYEDAFSSLSKFLDDLGGQGCIIASARSTYYEQEFLSRSGRESFARHTIRIDPISMMPWGDTEVRIYVEKRYEVETRRKVTYDYFKEQMFDVLGTDKNKPLIQKPFFVTKTADLILDKIDVSGGDLLDKLVDGYVERERSEKLLDRNGLPILTSAQIKRFINLVCEEMWATETRILDGDTVKILADIVFTEDGLVLDVERLKERAGTMAFFTPASGRQKIEFEHQLFFSYFLANTIVEALSKDSDALYSVLSRSALPENAASIAASKARSEGTVISLILRSCCAVAKLGKVRSVQACENAGGIVAATLREFSPLTEKLAPTLIISDVVFAGEAFRDIVVSNINFINVEFRRVDFTETRILHSVSTRSHFIEILVDEVSSHIDIAGVDLENVFGVRVRESESIVQHYKRERIREILRKCGMPIEGRSIPSGVANDAIDLLENFLRKFERSNLFWVEDFDNKRIITDNKWEKLKQLMLNNKILSADRAIAHQGTPRPTLKRMFLPEQIMDIGGERGGSVRNIASFWEDMRVSFPEKMPLS